MLWQGDYEAAAVTTPAGPFTMSDLDLPTEEHQYVPAFQRRGKDLLAPSIASQQP